MRYIATYTVTQIQMCYVLKMGYKIMLSFQNTIFKTNKKIEEMKAKMKWDQQVYRCSSHINVVLCVRIVT